MTYNMEKLHHLEMPPKIMSLQLLEEITDNFSKERKLGSGTFGNVYKGLHNGEEIAVKMLHLKQEWDDLKQFKNEFENLRKLKHQNIVRLLGYCYEIKHEYIELADGKTVFAQRIYRALCFEYLHNGSLEKHLHDEYHGLEWQTRYKIIKGACEGLKYLHEELETPIYHLDLKPENILLDTSMVPKLADFGLSKFVHNEQTRATQSFVGTIGYLPPEYIEKNLISKKLDIFSLGVVIIKIMTGDTGYIKCAKMSSQEFIDLVHENWRNRLRQNQGYESLEAECQVKRCIEIALDCIHPDRKKRPKIGVIVNWLNETENMIEKVEMALPLDESINVPVLHDEISPRSIETELLGISTSKLIFPFKPNKKVRCILNLTNKTENDNVYFGIRPNNPDRYIAEGLVGFVQPHFTLGVIVTMKEQQQPPSSEDELQIIMINKKVPGFISSLHQYVLGGNELDVANKRHDVFQKIIREMGGSDVSLMAVVMCDPNPASEEIGYQSELCFDTDYLGDLRSIDVHPTEPWILTGHKNGYFCIFKEKEQASTTKFEIVLSLSLGTSGSCVPVKFIARRNWVVSGDNRGKIRVYTYIDGSEEVMKLKAHDAAVKSLAVHPTHPFLLSSSDDTVIKLWNWDNGWACTREFESHWMTVRHLAFNPRHTDSFASISGKYGSTWPGSIRIWSIDSSKPIAEFIAEGSSVACYLTSTDRPYMAIAQECEQTKIWDMDSERYVHGLEETSNSKLGAGDVVAVACHPTLPILVTGTKCGQVCLWNSTSYRLEKVFRFTDSAVQSFGFKDGNGSQRLIGYSDIIKMVEINWPTLTGQHQDSL
ncbi:uncharacterized protein [Miscanthus floridulus]|uniref:uncharacterized protein n=1 Tax=Miscanthus floridulus TaxID=154761 RepID=UPI003459DC40